MEQAITLEQSIASRLKEIEHYRTLAEGAGAIRYDRDNVQTQRSTSAPFEAPLIHAQDLENESKREIKLLWRRLSEIRAVIGGVEDMDIQNVLRFRFLANKTIEEIAFEMKTSRSTVLRRMDDGYKAVSDLTGLPMPPIKRMPARERHHISRELFMALEEQKDE